MPSRTSLVVAAVVVLVLAMGIGARQLIEQQKAINGLRAQITSLRGPAVAGTPLTLYSVEGDASGAEQDAQQAESDVQSLQAQVGSSSTSDDLAGSITCLQTDIETIINDVNAGGTIGGYEVCGG